MHYLIKNSLLILLTLIPFCGQAQQKQETDTLYTDSLHMRTTRDKAVLYLLMRDRQQQLLRISWTQDSYDAKDHQLLQSSPVYYSIAEKEDAAAPLSSFYELAAYDGEVRYYYKNGRIRRTEQYHKGTARGDYHIYYENGQPLSVGTVKKNKVYLYHYYDSTGSDQLHNGSGVIKTESSDRQPQYIVVRDSIQGDIYYVDQSNKDTVYTSLQQRPEPPKGWDYFFRKLNKSIPAAQRKTFALKQLRFEFVVQADGSFDQITKQNSLEPVLDELVLSRLRALSPIQPARLDNGKKVKFRSKLIVLLF